MSRSKREEVLTAAAARFYAVGITASGVDTIAAEAGVSKATLYHHFRSKEDLVVAYVDRIEECWRARLAAQLDDIDEPLDRLLTYVATYADSSDHAQRGCAQQNAAAELPAGHPALAAIVRSKARVRADVAAILDELDHPEPATVAAAIAAMMEGACVVSGMERRTIDLDPIVAAARRLAAGPAR